MQSTFQRTAASLTGALALALGLVGVSAESASAASSCLPPNTYSVGNVCLYDGINRAGLLWQVAGNYNRRSSVVGTTLRDKASSWRNYSTFRWCAYDKRTGLPDEYLFTLEPRSYSNWVGNYANDRADYIEPCA